MARRNLKNLAEKILLETICLAGSEGLDKAPAKKIAEKCDITDATIFVYYKTKENLLKCAYEFVVQKFCEKLESCTNLIENKKYQEVWNKLFNYAVLNKHLTQYFVMYRHSSFYKSTDFKNCLNKYSFVMPDYTIEQRAAFLNMLLSFFAEAALTVAKGKIPKSKKTLDVLYKLTLGAIF